MQEALDKMRELGDLDIEWHYIGTIQANKTRKIAQHFSWVHTVAEEKIAQRLNAQRPPHYSPLQVCIEVNLTYENTKTGVYLDEVPRLAKAILQMPNLNLRGLMTIPKPLSDFTEQRKVFNKLKLALVDLNQQCFNLDTLSMGMTNDFAAAIAEGATIVRIGTAIFGKRDRINSE